MHVVKLPADVESDILTEDTLQVLKEHGLAQHRSECHFTIDDGMLMSYYSISKRDTYCDLDTRHLIVLGYGNYIYYSFVYVKKNDPARFADSEEYICIDMNNEASLIKIRPYHNDLLFINKSVEQFNECAKICTEFSAENSARLSALHADDVYDPEASLGQLYYALSQVDPDIVGDEPLYEYESGKLWNEAVETFFDL